MNKRDLVLSLVNGGSPAPYIPAAFFLHFGPAFERGQAAVDRHLEFFRYTGMDFVKVQYEQNLAPAEPIHSPRQWLDVPLVPEEDFEPTVSLVRALAQAVHGEALVVLTVYSPLMWAVRACRGVNIANHLREDPASVQKGLEIMTANVIRLVKACRRAGAEGFYVSTQGGEAFRFPGTDFFRRYIMPTDLAVWDQINDCEFNILHICDYEGPYDDLAPFQDYPGHVVNSSLTAGSRTYTPAELARLFDRPFMGGMERKGVLAAGPLEQIQDQARRVLADAPPRFILAADCTVPGDTPWENLRTAVAEAHRFTR